MKTYKIFGKRCLVEKIMSKPKITEDAVFTNVVKVLGVGDVEGVATGDYLKVTAIFEHDGEVYVHDNQILRRIDEDEL